MTASSIALVTIPTSTPRKCSDSPVAILSIERMRAVSSPTSRWLKYSTGSRSSRVRHRFPAMTDIRTARRRRHRCFSHVSPYTATAAPAITPARAQPQGSRSARTRSTKTPSTTGATRASTASMSPHASAYPIAPPAPPSHCGRRCAMPGASPPGRKSGPTPNRSATPENPWLNSSAVIVRRPMAGSLRWNRSRSKPSRTRKWLNSQNRTRGSGCFMSAGTSPCQPAHSRP